MPAGGASGTEAAEEGCTSGTDTPRGGVGGEGKYGTDAPSIQTAAETSGTNAPMGGTAKDASGTDATNVRTARRIILWRDAIYYHGDVLPRARGAGPGSAVRHTGRGRSAPPKRHARRGGGSALPHPAGAPARGAIAPPGLESPPRPAGVERGYLMRRDFLMAKRFID